MRISCYCFRGLILLLCWGQSPVFAINWTEARPTVDLSLKMESEYLFRGIKRAGPVINPGVWLGLYEFYLGAEWFEPISKKTDPNQIDTIVGWGTEVSPGVVLDLGGVYRTYPDSERRRSRELYLGAEFEGIQEEGWLSYVYPRIYGYYDWDEQGGTFSGIVSFSYDYYLSEWFHGEAVWLRLEPFVGWSAPRNAKNRAFYGAKIELYYALGKGITATLGGRYSGVTHQADRIGRDRDHFWWGASVRYGF